jgi:hypothetical protein
MCNSNSAFLKTSSRYKLPAPLPTSNKFAATEIILFTPPVTSSKEIFNQLLKSAPYPYQGFKNLSTSLSNHLFISSTAVFHFFLHSV